MAPVPLSLSPASDDWSARVRPQRSLRALVWRRFLKHRPAVLGLCVSVCIVLGCILMPWIFNYDAGRTQVDIIRDPPSPAHLFGTDELGRDLLVRLWDGGRVSLLIGVATMAIAITLGTLVGALAGYYGKFLDQVLMRCTDFMLSIPQLFLLLIFAQLLRSTNNPQLSGGPLPIIVIIGVLSWMPVARLVRGQFLSLKQMEFVEAARMSGTRNMRIMLRHFVPNAAMLIVVAV